MDDIKWGFPFSLPVFSSFLSLYIVNYHISVMSATISMHCPSALPGVYPHHQTTTSSNSASTNHYIEPSIPERSSSISSSKMVILSKPSETSSLQPSLQAVLMDQVGGPYSLENFADFLQSQFCYENLAFWLATSQYELAALSLSRSIREESPQFNLHQDSLHCLNQAQTRLFSDLQSDMLVILETFILPESPFEVNLSDTIRSRLLKAVTDGDYHPQILELARDSVMDLMKSTSYPLFLESISGRDMSTCSSPSFSSSSTFSHDDNDRDRGSWRLKAKEHFKLVSRALKKTSS